MLFSSLVSAAGNFIFLFGLGDASAYIASLSISSFIVGGVCYTILPNFLYSASCNRIKVYISICALLAVLFAPFSTIASFVFLSTLMVIAAEIVFSTFSAWGAVMVVRGAVLISGFFSWVMSDVDAIIMRGFFAAILVLILLWFSKFDFERRLEGGKLSTPLLVFLALINLTWVYILPLLLVIDSSQFEKKILYVMATAFPLLYHKAQDVIFKVNVLSGTGSVGSVRFLTFFAVPLACVYIFFPFLQYFAEGGDKLVLAVVFSGLSLLFLAVNLRLTVILQSPRN